MVVEEDQISICIVLHFLTFFYLRKKKKERERTKTKCVGGLFEERLYKQRKIKFVCFTEPVISKDPKRMSLSAFTFVLLMIRFRNFEIGC